MILNFVSNIGDYAVANGLGAIKECQFILKYIDSLRNKPYLARFIKVEGTSDEFFLSLTMREVTANTSKLFEVDQSVNLMFTEYKPEPSETGKLPADNGGVKASFVEVATIPHPGSHLIHVRLPAGTEVKSGDTWSKEITPTRIYLKLEESLKTAKYRLKSINAIHYDNDNGVTSTSKGYRPRYGVGDESARDLLEGANYIGELPDECPGLGDDDEEPTWTTKDQSPLFQMKEVDFRTQRSILMGSGVRDLTYVNYLRDVSETDVDCSLIYN